MRRRTSRFSLARLRRAPFVRLLAALALFVCVGAEILPFAAAALPSGSAAEQALRFEPLDVCGHDDPLFGALFDVPLLLTEGSPLPLETGVRQLPSEAVAFLPEGFPSAIDHPPRRTA